MNYPTNIAGLCAKQGMSRQNYYQSRTARKKVGVDAGLACSLVRRERANQT